MSDKKYSSARKLDSLPLGTRIRFGDKYSPTWIKEKKGWKQIGSSFPIRWDSKTVLGYNANRQYVIVEPIKGENE